MNFEEDIRKQIIQLLKDDKIKFNEKESTRNLLISYLNFLNRLILPIPRKVHISDNIENIIENNELDKKYIDALLKFKDHFEKGIDMNSTLSKNIFYSDISIKERQNLTYKKTRDYLLDDWGIHHLHLDKDKGNRSKYLLFIKVTNNEIYFIDILSHNEKNVFAKQELLETLYRNWNFLLEKYKYPGAIAAHFKFTDKEITEARKRGTIIFIQINNNVYGPMGGGLASSGTNMMHSVDANYILNESKNIENYIKNNYEHIKKQIQKYIKSYTNDLEFKIKLVENGFLVTEINTNFNIWYIIKNAYISMALSSINKL